MMQDTDIIVCESLFSIPLESMLYLWLWLHSKLTSSKPYMVLSPHGRTMGALWTYYGRTNVSPGILNFLNNFVVPNIDLKN